MLRVRIKYSKGKAVKFISHRDVIRVFERALRRAKLPIKYSQGYNPHMKLSWGPPLKVGQFSDEQYFDMYLEEHIEINKIPDLVNNLLPTDIRIIEVASIELSEPSLFSQLTNQAGQSAA